MIIVMVVVMDVAVVIVMAVVVMCFIHIHNSVWVLRSYTYLDRRDGQCRGT